MKMEMAFLRFGFCILFLVVPNFANSDIGFFWHVSDFHWDHTYMGEDLSCNDVVEKYGLYGDYWCDAPWLLVNDSVWAMRDLKHDVDFILWTGDNTPHAKDEDVSFDIHDAILGNITTLLKEVFPTVPVYATLGNHDYFPHNQFPPRNNLLYNRTFDKWVDWIGENCSDSFRKGAYYTLKTETGLRIIGLNTNLYYTSNKQTGTIDDPSDQFSWLEGVLESAQTNNESVLITAHIPPGINPSDGTSSWMYQQYNTRLNEILQKYAGIITGMHYGHEHSDNFRVFHDDEGSGILVGLCAPSVTPWRYKIPNRTGPAHNPSIRLLKYDKSNGNLLDYTQFYMDLPEVNRNNVSEWKIEYNATDVYGIPDLSPRSMAQLVKKMEARDGKEFEAFHRFWTVSVSSEFQEECDAKCHAKFYCNFRHQDFDKFQSCYDKLTISASTIPIVNKVSILFSLIIFVCIILF